MQTYLLLLVAFSLSQLLNCDRAFYVWRAASRYRDCTCDWALEALKRGRSTQVCTQAGPEGVFEDGGEMSIPAQVC